MGEPLINEDEVLFRQIHPNCIHNGEPASDRFKPLPNDKGKMSVDRGSLTDAAASHALYTSTGNQSGAVYGVYAALPHPLPLQGLVSGQGQRIPPEFRPKSVRARGDTAQQ